MDQAESEHLLRDCRELLTNRMRISMSRMLCEVEDVLFEMATTSQATGQTSHYVDAVREIRMKKREIQLRFENRFLEQFDYSVGESRKVTTASSDARPGPGYPAWVIDINQVRLEQFEQRIEKMRGECRSALSELDRHVSALLQSAPGDNFDNPLQPKTVFNAFRESCRDIQIGPDIRQILMERFDKYIGPALQDVYADLNHLFVSYESAPGLHGRGTETLSRPAVDGGLDQPSLLVGNWIRGYILTQTGQVAIPGFISEFLSGPWSHVLENIYEKYGDNSPEWERALQVVTDLQECTRPAATRDIRQQQLWMLPGLLYRLKAGMKIVATPLKLQAEFFSRLKSHHIRNNEAGGISSAEC